MELHSKTILITGSTDGLGKVMAHRFAKQGAKLILHGRHLAKGQSLLKEIKTASGNSTLFYYNADFASLEEVNIVEKFKWYFN